MMKPIIKWWGNGDVHASCYSVYRKCYPNAIATFRTETYKINRLPVTVGSITKTP